MSGTTCWILHLAQKIISCLLLILALLLYLLFEEEVKDTGFPSPPNRCKGVAMHAGSDRGAAHLLAPLWLPIPASYPPPSAFSLLDCCLFQMVGIKSVLDPFFFTRTQDFPFLNSCLYWLACLHVHCTWVASIKMHPVPTIKFRQDCPKS